MQDFQQVQRKVVNKDFSACYVQDYPSVGQLAMQLEKNNIQPIFAVTQNMEAVYKVNRFNSAFVSFFFGFIEQTWTRLNDLSLFNFVPRTSLK